MSRISVPRPRRLRTRLLVANLVVAGAALGTVLVAVSLVGPGDFAAAMGHRPGDPMARAMDAATLAAFGDAVGTALVAAGAIAVVAAAAVSLAVSQRIADPVARLASSARRIAAGHYAERVSSSGEDEVSELADSFNAMTASLEATERRRVELVGDVAHELRTPLSTLDGYLEGLEDGVVQPTDETWRLLRSETRRLTRLIDDLQELWRAEARQLPLRLTSVDCARVVLDAVARHAPTAASRGLAIRSEVPTDLHVRADRDRLAQILGNYLSNAVRFSPDGGAIVVTGERVDDGIVLRVRDDGPGLTDEQRSAVFERFYRVDASRSRALGGSGIGLAISRAVAAAMGGSVWATSDGTGRGSTFHVSLPAATSS